MLFDVNVFGFFIIHLIFGQLNGTLTISFLKAVGEGDILKCTTFHITFKPSPLGLQDQAPIT